jgi:hypothetical protein
MRVEPGFLRVGAAFSLIGKRFLRIGLPRNVSDALFTAETLYFYAESFFYWPTAARIGHYYEGFSLEFCAL